MARQIDPSEEEMIKGNKLPVPSMRTKWLIFMVSFWALAGMASLYVQEEFIAALGDLGEDGSVENESTHAHSEPIVLLREDFTLPNAYWFIPSGDAPGIEDILVKNGSAILRVNKALFGAGVRINDYMGGRGKRWLHVTAEIGLRCSDDNSLESGIGVGHRSWGFFTGDPDELGNSLCFSSYSPESGPGLYGFWAQVEINGSLVQMVPITGIDMRDPHNYSIDWNERGAIFLVDENTVAVTGEVIDSPMGLGVRLSNHVFHFAEGTNRITWWEDPGAETDMWIMVDNMMVAMGRERAIEYAEEMGHTIISAGATISAAKELGMEVQELEDDLDIARTALQEDGYVPGMLHIKTMALADLAPARLMELSDLFSEAGEALDGAELDGRTRVVLEADLAHAMDAWQECEFSRAERHLRRILGGVG
jgi:hypothetical protein